MQANGNPSWGLGINVDTLYHALSLCNIFINHLINQILRCIPLYIIYLTIILDPDLECHLLTFFRLLVVFCHILSTTGE